MLQELLEKSRHNHLPGCFPWISQDPCIIRIYFRISFVHPATQTGAISNQLTVARLPETSPLEKDPKDFSRSPAMIVFLSPIWPLFPPTPPQKSKKNNMSPEKGTISKGIWVFQPYEFSRTSCLLFFLGELIFTKSTCNIDDGTAVALSVELWSDAFSIDFIKDLSTKLALFHWNPEVFGAQDSSKYLLHCFFSE